jgi:hypothetical protein
VDEIKEYIVKKAYSTMRFDSYEEMRTETMKITVLTNEEEIQSIHSRHPRT